MWIKDLFCNHKWKLDEKTNINMTKTFCYVKTKIFQCEKCLKTKKKRSKDFHQWVDIEQGYYSGFGYRTSKRRCANCGMVERAASYNSCYGMGHEEIYPNWVKDESSYFHGRKS